ncbi:hypothetical protein EON65_45350 [archaeon]|nr:MAG: hypothetical protein EON65_45350 [archaeon]
MKGNDANDCGGPCNSDAGAFFGVCACCLVPIIFPCPSAKPVDEKQFSNGNKSQWKEMDRAGSDWLILPVLLWLKAHSPMGTQY